MVGITERNRQKNELARIGFSLKYVDEWQPKTTLYLHKPSYNVGGGISQNVGAALKNVPGNPDYVLRKARIGLFPWEPGGTCTCRWCLKNRDPIFEPKEAIEGTQIHKYGHKFGKDDGAVCKVNGCDAIRTVPFKKRKEVVRV
jgi:hypothetical protein